MPVEPSCAPDPALPPQLRQPNNAVAGADHASEDEPQTEVPTEEHIGGVHGRTVEDYACTGDDDADAEHRFEHCVHRIDEFQVTLPRVRGSVVPDEDRKALLERRVMVLGRSLQVSEDGRSLRGLAKMTTSSIRTSLRDRSQ
ncbi:hypothetical protein AAEP80_04060 [Curtobacterium sp. L3-7]|uniref:hypothetical protein n=1 Tax=Curtobacterium sp. L3-7 TaxID=3138787 RepID=UPI003B5184A5